MISFDLRPQKIIPVSSRHVQAKVNSQGSDGCFPSVLESVASMASSSTETSLVSVEWVPPAVHLITNQEEENSLLSTLETQI